MLLSANCIQCKTPRPVRAHGRATCADPCQLLTALEPLRASLTQQLKFEFTKDFAKSVVSSQSALRTHTQFCECASPALTLFYKLTLQAHARLGRIHKQICKWILRLHTRLCECIQRTHTGLCGWILRTHTRFCEFTPDSADGFCEFTLHLANGSCEFTLDFANGSCESHSILRMHFANSHSLLRIHTRLCECILRIHT